MAIEDVEGVDRPGGLYARPRGNMNASFTYAYVNCPHCGVTCRGSGPSADSARVNAGEKLSHHMEWSCDYSPAASQNAEKRAARDSRGIVALLYLVIAALAVYPGIALTILACKFLGLHPSGIVLLGSGVIASGIIYLGMKRILGDRSNAVYLIVSGSLVLLTFALGGSDLFLDALYEFAPMATSRRLPPPNPVHGDAGAASQVTAGENQHVQDEEASIARAAPASSPELAVGGQELPAAHLMGALGDGSPSSAASAATAPEQRTADQLDGPPPSPQGRQESAPSATEVAGRSTPSLGVEWVPLQRSWSRLVMETTGCDGGAYDSFRASPHLDWNAPDGPTVRLRMEIQAREVQADHPGVNAHIILTGEWEGSGGRRTLMRMGPLYQHSCFSAQAKTGFAGVRSDGLLLVSLEWLPQRNPEVTDGATGRTKRAILGWNPSTNAPRSLALWEGETRVVPQLYRAR